MEFQYQTPTLAVTAPPSEVPAGFANWNTNLDYWNSFYWDQRAWAEGPGDITKADVTHWLLSTEWPMGTAYSVTVPHSIKKPLESRVWYAYPGQTTPSSAQAVGWWREASRVGRVLDDGTSQIAETTYNPQGQVTSRTDPLGRRTSYTYGANGIDLLEVRQTTGALNDLLARYADYTAQHQPQAVTDAAGQTTSFTYNAAGQPLTVTNAKDETTAYAYDGDGKLLSVTGPVSGATTTYTYDGYGRVRTVTDADGYTVTTDYDALDRPTRTAYPDGTFEETVYDKLDAARSRDRLGRWTYRAHDASRRVILTRDPAGRTITQEWCACGSLDALIDAKGQATRWERDLQGRVTREVRADGVTATTYTYEATTSRLKTVTDPKHQVTTYTYNLDDGVQSIAYTNAPIATPSVSFTYETGYNRVQMMLDGTGTTTYAYHPAGSTGAGQLASVDGPLPNDTITYAYDELGRVRTRAINGVGVTWTYDALGRTTSEQNVLGTFNYDYVGPTARLATVAYPNGQTSSYSYYPNQGDQRLQTIHHRYLDGRTLSKFDYTYDSVGNILTWRQQADESAVLWKYGYDPADQLRSAITHATDPQETILKRYYYTYDPAGNRTSEQIDETITTDSHDNLNRLVSQTPGGALMFRGQLDEPGAVMINGKPATVFADHRFEGTAQVTPGTNAVTIMATDLSGNSRAQTYEVDIAGSAKTLTYDANGNLTSDGSRNFEWDGSNRLVAVVRGTSRTEFSYDGRDRRVARVDRESGVEIVRTTFVWCGAIICEERGTGEPMIRRFFARAEASGEVPVLYTRDHLGSVREKTDGGSLVEARYEYDPFGKAVELVEDMHVSAGFSNHLYHRTDNLVLALYRVYDPALGRWLSEDPLGFGGGSNHFAYVDGNPLRRTDPFGLQPVECRNCDREKARAAQDGVNSVCRASSAGDGPCHTVLQQNGMVSCVQQRCRQGGWKVVCMTMNCGPQSCGGPCSWASGPQVQNGVVFLQPRAFERDGICGSMANTVAHEMAHTCGVGPDGDPSRNPAHKANQKKAEEVALACGGR